MLSFIGAIKE